MSALMVCRVEQVNHSAGWCQTCCPTAGMEMEMEMEMGVTKTNTQQLQMHPGEIQADDECEGEKKKRLMRV